MIEYLVKKRKITLLFFIALVLYGTFSFFQLPKQEIPDIVVSQAIVTTAYPGATPETIEQTVTKKIEQKIKEMQGIDTITSTSSEGVSSIVVQLKSGENPKEKWTELRSKVKDAEGDLPADAFQPVVNDNLIKTFISAYAITAKNPEQLKELNELTTSWKDQLRAVPGISDVEIQGLPEQQIKVQLDTQKMQQYNVTWRQVSQSIRNENDRMPIGDIDYKKRNYQLRLSDTRSIENLSQIIITRTQDGYPIYLSDIASIELSHAKDTYYGYTNGKPALTLNISGELGSDVPKLADAAAAEMKKLEKSLPKGYELELLYAQKDSIDSMFKNLSKELIIAMVAVIIVCMMGLNLVTSTIVTLAIPISVAIGLIFLPMFDVTLNQMTVIGIIIVLSLLVDDAIVVNDNIERRLTVLKESPFDAAVNGTKEVIISIITATLATISAFAPLLILQGDMGAFIRPIPLVITVALLASMVMSLTIVPIFRDWHENRHKHKRVQSDKPAGFLGKQIQQLNQYYSHKLMPFVIQSPLKIGLIGLLIGTAGYGLAPFVPVELFGSAEEKQFSVEIEMPTGTSLEETNRIVQEISMWAEQQPNVEKISSAAGGGAPKLFNVMAAPGGASGAQIAVVGTEDMDLVKTTTEWEDYLIEKYPGISIVASVASSGPTNGAPISIRFTGKEMDELSRLSENTKNIISQADGTYNIKDSMGTARYSLEFQVNKAMMDQKLVSYTDLTSTLGLITQGLSVTEFDTGNDLIDIKMYVDSEKEDPTTLFQRLSITNALGQQIPLAQLAELKPTFSVQQIAHYNLERSITVSADVREGTTVAEAMAVITPQLKAMNLPEGYNWEIGGETEQQTESFTDLGQLFIACLFIIIILITLQFYSLSIPVIILTTVYLAAAGGIIGMFITRTPIGFMSLMGITALAGIVVRNGIVLIEFMEDARKHEGMMLPEAVLKATEARFRPILLTATAAILGLLPVALIGDVLFRPMAVTIISGVIFSTVLTLFVVPALYMVLAEWKTKRAMKKMDKEQKREQKLFL